MASLFQPRSAASRGRSFNCSRSVTAGARGTLSFRPFSNVPVQHPFLPYIEEADQHQPDIDNHLPESEHLELAGDDRPGIKEDRFHVEQDEEHGHHVKLDAETLLGVAGGHDAALIRRVLSGSPFVLAQEVRKGDHDRGQNSTDDHLEQQGYITGKVVVRHEWPVYNARLTAKG